jgi:hypothetical protein
MTMGISYHDHSKLCYKIITSLDEVLAASYMRQGDQIADLREIEKRAKRMADQLERTLYAGIDA